MAATNTTSQSPQVTGDASLLTPVQHEKASGSLTAVSIPNHKGPVKYLLSTRYLFQVTNLPSVIAVHGINTTSPETWQAYKNRKDDSEGCTIWLSDADMLPSAIPNAQIWTFHYNTSWLSDAPVERLSNLAEKLLLTLYETFFATANVGPAVFHR
jgi:hypothetical protein